MQRIHLIDSDYGEDLPQVFAQRYLTLPGVWSGFDATDIYHLLKGPANGPSDGEWFQRKMYWAAWLEVETNARYTQDGVTYSLLRDGDPGLWLAPIESKEPA